jgi:nucleoid-associated protein EbfC
MNMNQIMKQAQAMQKKMMQMQEEIAKKEFEGSSGAGAVKLIINGKLELLSLKLNPEIVSEDDTEILEDLIVAAFNDAKKKYDASSEENTSGMMGGMQLPPGLKMPF